MSVYWQSKQREKDLIIEEMLLDGIRKTETRIMQPIHEKILVRPFPPETETKSGIIIPPSVQERPSKATVIAVGGGVKDRPMVLQVGDTVFHVLNAGTPIEHEGELLYMLRDVDCLARIPEESARLTEKALHKTLELREETGVYINNY
jgi:chaperonin GroES